MTAAAMARRNGHVTNIATAAKIRSRHARNQIVLFRELIAEFITPSSWPLSRYSPHHNTPAFLYLPPSTKRKRPSLESEGQRSKPLTACLRLEVQSQSELQCTHAVRIDQVGDQACRRAA